MRRIAETTETKERCLGRALEFEWLAENSLRPSAVAYALYRARYWRSLALVARSSYEPDTERPLE